MAYTHTRRSELRAALRSRLGETSARYWADAELNLCTDEALRTWQAASRFYRERGVFQTEANVPFYDLSSKLSPLLGYTITDANAITLMEYHLLEPPTPTVWTGTDMFSLAELTEAVERRRNQFLLETAATLTRSLDPIAPPPSGRVELADTVIDVRRAAWRSTGGTYTHLWREDEHNLNSYKRGWSVNPDTPAAFSVILTPPVQLQLAPVPADEGQLDLVTVRTGAALDPGTGVLLGVPDDYVWAVKWGALADLLGKEGPARDPTRAAYCERRWREGVDLCRGSGLVLEAEIDGLPVPPATLEELDAYAPTWQNSIGTPTAVATAGANILAVGNAVPDGIYSVTLDVVRRFPIPNGDGDWVRVGREHLDAVIDYALHIASFKMGGAEFEATMPHYERLLRLAAVHNDRLRAQAPTFRRVEGHGLKEAKQRPRRRSDIELEALEYATP